jgi:hypothetical protein
VWASRAATGRAQPAPGTSRRARRGTQPAAAANRTSTRATTTSTTVPGRPVQLLSTGTPQVACIQAAASEVAATSLASRDGKYMLSFGSQGGLQLVGAQSQALVWTLPARQGTKPEVKASSLCLAPNGTLLLLGSKARAVLWQSTHAAPIGAGYLSTASSPSPTEQEDLHGLHQQPGPVDRRGQPVCPGLPGPASKCTIPPSPTGDCPQSRSLAKAQQLQSPSATTVSKPPDPPPCSNWNLGAGHQAKGQLASAACSVPSRRLQSRTDRQPLRRVEYVWIGYPL